MSTPPYPPESAGALMSAKVPVCHPDDDIQHILRYLSSSEPWDALHCIYVVDAHNKLLGYFTIAELLKRPVSTAAEHLMRPPETTLSPTADQEKAVFLAIKYDIDSVPVVDAGNTLLGVVTPKAIIDIMHTEHLEDSLLSAGVRRGKNGGHLMRLATGGLRHSLAARAPWLIFGAAVGLGLGLISSFFEASLERSIALAYFVPVVAYIADSVGTQSEAIIVRALATLKISPAGYLARELLIGASLGAILGLMGGLGAILISHSASIGLVVGLSLLTASTVASILASFIPILFKSLGKDPALGSGPLSTALQDVISVVVYFVFATVLIGR